MSATLLRSGVCPTFFRARCREAARDNQGGYLWVGHTLAGALAGLIHSDFEDDDLAAMMDELADRINRSDDAAVLGWFDAVVPRCMALIPRRRREQFLKGVYQFAEEGNDISSY